MAASLHGLPKMICKAQASDFQVINADFGSKMIDLLSSTRKQSQPRLSPTENVQLRSSQAFAYRLEKVIIAGCPELDR